MAAQEEPEMPESTTPSSGRLSRRVGVKLRAAVVLVGRDTAYLGYTQDVSESGLLIRDYNGPKLAKGSLVCVNLRGVIDDNVNEESQQYQMRVVRHRGTELALKFDSSPK
jgi:PilZ domain